MYKIHVYNNEKNKLFTSNKAHKYKCNSIRVYYPSIPLRMKQEKYYAFFEMTGYFINYANDCCRCLLLLILLL